MPGDLCVGMGGLGKITLFGGVYESPEISERFEKCVFATITHYQSCRAPYRKSCSISPYVGSGSKILVLMMQHMWQSNTTREWKRQKQ